MGWVIPTTILNLLLTENTLINSKLQELAHQKRHDKFCANNTNQLEKGCLIPEKQYFIRDKVLCRYTKEREKLPPSMVMPCSMINALL